MKNSFYINASELIDLTCGKRTIDCETVNRHLKRETYKLYYVISGSGTITTGGLSFKIDKGCSFAVFPYTSVLAKPNEGEPLSFTWVETSGSSFSSMLNLTSLTKTKPYTGKMNIDGFERFFDIPEIKSEAVFSHIRAHSKLILLMSYYIEFFPSESGSQKNYVIAAQNYIGSHFDDSSLSVADVADYVKVDRTYLYRLFKEETGMSVIEYINNRRISNAELLLSDRSMSIKDIAFSVGFADQLYFSRVFKKKKGCSPTEFRKRVL